MITQNSLLSSDLSFEKQAVLTERTRRLRGLTFNSLDLQFKEGVFSEMTNECIN